MQTMTGELVRCAEAGEECSFYLNGKRRILYGWGQCDGVFLNIADETGCIIWQAVGRSRAECAEKLRRDFLAAGHLQDDSLSL